MCKTLSIEAFNDDGALNSYLYYGEAVTSPPWDQDKEEQTVEQRRENSGI